jgi:acetyl-CoA acetyltransferase
MGLFRQRISLLLVLELLLIVNVQKIDLALTESYDAPFSSMMYDGLTDAFSGQAMGLTAENVAEKYHN